MYGATTNIDKGRKIDFEHMETIGISDVILTDKSLKNSKYQVYNEQRTTLC